MDDLNNRLRAGILDLRSLAAGLKEEEKASAERRAQDAQQLAEGETSPRGPEVTHPTLASAPSPPPDSPIRPDFSHLNLCPSRPLPPPPLPLRLLPERHSCHLTPARLSTLRSALSTHAQA